MATGYLDSRGVWIYGEQDLTVSHSELLNLGQRSVSTAILDAENRVRTSPEFALAAETAIAKELAGGNILLRDELSAVKTLKITHPVYSEIRLSHDFRRVGGTLREGGEVGTKSGNIETAIKLGTGELDLTHDFRRTEPAPDAEGLTPQWVLDNWAKRQTPSHTMRGIVSYGDSMTTDNGDLGLSYAAALGEALAVPGYDGGVSGDSPFPISWRAGALASRITLPDNTLPPSGTVPVTMVPERGWRGNRTWKCTIATITGEKIFVELKQAVGGHEDVAIWTLSQVDGSSPKTILPGTRIRYVSSHYAPDLPDDAFTMPATYWAGRNDMDIERGVTALKAFISQHRDPGNRRLIRPVFNRRNEPAGSPEYDTVMSINSALQEIAGDDWFDSRSKLIESGLEIMAISPTPDDLIAISEDRIPLSLLHDYTHLNIAGRRALARIEANEIYGRNW